MDGGGQRQQNNKRFIILVIMFMPQSSNEWDTWNNENVCWMVEQEQPQGQSRYKSPFAAKVRWEFWVGKKGCCKTIGPPPKLCGHCPEQFLRKHSRRPPVFFRPEELRVPPNKDDYLKKFVYEEPPRIERKNVPLDTGITKLMTTQSDGCPFPRPPSRLGLFRAPFEPSYEQKYKMTKPQDCCCDDIQWEALMRAAEHQGMLAGRRDKEQDQGQGQTGPTKDFIRANALQAIRMPPRRLKRCYVDQCGVHLLDMSESPYVLRPGFGKIPPYLYKRKMELFQKDCEAKRKMEDIGLMTDGAIQVVNDMEKDMVVKGLKDYWAELLNQYRSLPLNYSGNARQKELKQSLEDRMKEVEGDLKLLTSCSSLFVGDVKESRYL